MIGRFLPVFYLMLTLVTTGLHAQLRDIRLAPELRDYSLPQEAQVQSVASIGNRSLVAWASTAFDSDSNIINVLWMRLLDGATPLAENRVVHSPQARPYGFVLVIASADQFLIFFNDRRSDAPGIYVQRMDFNGNRIGDEQRIDIGAVRNDTINKPKSEVSALTYSSLPGWTFVQVDSARPFVVRDNAVVDTRPLAIDHMQGAYYLAEDTSVAVLKGKSLYFFHNLFDTEAERVVAVPGLDSALANSEVVIRDSTKEYAVIYAVISDAVTHGCTYWKVSLGDTMTSVDSVFADMVPYIPPYPAYPYYRGPALPYKNYGAQRIRSCDNTYRIIVRYLGWTYTLFKGDPIPSPLDRIPSSTDINADGYYIRTLSPKLPAFIPCGLKPIQIQRQIDSQATQLMVAFPADTVLLKQHTAFVRPQIPRSYPNLFLDSSNLIINWSFNGEKSRSQSGIWNITEGPEPILYFLPLGFDKADRNPQAVQEGIVARRDENVVHRNGVTWAYSNQDRWDTVWGNYYPKGPVQTAFLHIQVLTSKGWSTLYKRALYARSGLYDGGVSFGDPSFSVKKVGHDLYTNTLLAYIRSAIWNYDNSKSEESTRIYSFKVEDSLGLKFIWDADHQRLSLDRWLRWHLADDSTRWSFDVVDTAGTIYHSRTLLLDGDPRSIFITQNYPDHSTAVIWGGIGGVRGTFLSHSLDILQENVQISQTRDSVSYPSAAYRNDTLFVAWEDYRNGGIADVYGAAFTGAPKASGVEMTQSMQNNQSLSLWPNPARDHLRITLPQHSGAASLEILDALGRLHSYVDIPAGAIAHELDLRTLEPGVYIARLSGSTPSHSIRFVVTH